MPPCELRSTGGASNSASGILSPTSNHPSSMHPNRMVVLQTALFLAIERRDLQTVIAVKSLRLDVTAPYQITGVYGTPLQHAISLEWGLAFPLLQHWH